MFSAKDSDVPQYTALLATRHRESASFCYTPSTTEGAALQVTFPLSQKGWRQMKKVLEAMEPGIVEGDQDTELDNGDEEAGE